MIVRGRRPGICWDFRLALILKTLRPRGGHPGLHWLFRNRTRDRSQQIILPPLIRLFSQRPSNGNPGCEPGGGGYTILLTILLQWSISCTSNGPDRMAASIEVKLRLADYTVCLSLYRVREPIPCMWDCIWACIIQCCLGAYSWYYHPPTLNLGVLIRTHHSRRTDGLLGQRQQNSAQCSEVVLRTAGGTIGL